MIKLLDNLLTENEQKILLFLVAFAFLGLVVGDTFLVADQPAEEVEEVDFGTDYAVKYDLLTASKEELITIPGIGEKRANDILNYRHEVGFLNKSDLLNVKGIGKATYLKIEPYFNDLGNSEIAAETSQPSQAQKEEKININCASLDELTRLPGIGPAKAERILALRRELGNFSNKDQLLQVKGIGAKTLEKMRDMIILEDR
ncbi:MAG: ComEA family DNA-binding protein [Candidatus Cloacimonetes bacterium]|nr:ComEA family DNA-binding protein [Candidatus Cloacimonadota bacterium]